MPVDKLTIVTADYLVKDAKKVHPTFAVQPKPILLQSVATDDVLFRDSNGKTYKGQKAYLNTDLYQMTITDRGLMVQFNPSKPYHPFQLIDDDNQFQSRIKHVTDDLQGRGVLADWNNAKVCRLDLAKNAVMNNPVSAYGDVFKWLAVKRANKQAQYPDGYMAGNNSFTAVLYNKGAEMQQAGVATTFTDDNLLRVEGQIRKHNAVNSITGCKTLNELQQAGVGHLKTVYRSVINDRVFRQKEIANNQYVMQFGDELQVIKQLETIYGKKQALTTYLKLKGMPSIIAEYGSLQTFGLMLDSAGYSRKTRAKYMKQLQQQLQVYGKLWQARENNVSKLYRELLNKIAV